MSVMSVTGQEYSIFLLFHFSNTSSCAIDVQSSILNCKICAIFHQDVPDVYMQSVQLYGRLYLI